MALVVSHCSSNKAQNPQQDLQVHTWSSHNLDIYTLHLHLCASTTVASVGPDMYPPPPPYCDLTSVFLQGLVQGHFPRKATLGLPQVSQVHSLGIFFQRFYLFIFRQRGREGEREGEKHQCVVASLAPLSGTGPQPRHVP